jgi:sulfite reductase (NADPH) flavoprotein alpha-component
VARHERPGRPGRVDVRHATLDGPPDIRLGKERLLNLSASQVRWLSALLVVVLYALLCGAVWWRQGRRRRAAADAAAQFAPVDSTSVPVLIAYASQTGSAEHLAWQTAKALHDGGTPARLVTMNDVDAALLASTERALFITSTYGEGDPPDNAGLFAQRLMSSSNPPGAGADPDLAALHYGLLALGDSDYQHFCGFGRSLDAWLAGHGARSLFGRIEVDRGDEAALLRWRHEVGRMAGIGDLPDWQAPDYEPWTLTHRRLLNPGSLGEQAWLVTLAAQADASWESGDLVQVLAPADRERPREYSIASIASQGVVELLVRQQRHDDGSLGAASGWLTRDAAIGDRIDLRLRAHRAFRIEGNGPRPLILIGNGTGMAGLRSHLLARDARRERPNWLLFGERQAAHDLFFEDEIRAWLSSGLLARADFAFSRDQPQRIHVQHRLREAAEPLRAWVQDGAAIYVCGSLQGMASAVDEALVDLLGAATVQRLTEQGRYRRDVY